ncbi:PREDICTED: olfactory receptor 14A16-like, partial [Mesitornis unicolor]|uniref:olfactory receptor 14A16-like n=1 Tax=Mesitornis unicolor TaxID=54374 RepID=UPI0005289EBB
LLHFWLFLSIYLSVVLGNSLIITAIACDHHLHTPVYFFLLNLSTLELSLLTVMAYDCYVAICKPLHYRTLLGNRACAHMFFRAVLRIPSEQGQHKAFSTCLPHLVMVSLFVTTGTFAYLKPLSTSSPSLNLVVTILYSVLPPAVNPLVYSIRNQELKDALRK